MLIIITSLITLFAAIKSVCTNPKFIDFEATVMEKLYDIEAKLISMDNSTLISEHKDLVAGDVQQKLKTLEDMIMPLLQNLKKNPEKEYIHWPNRTAIIDKQIEKIRAVTQFYE